MSLLPITLSVLLGGDGLEPAFRYVASLKRTYQHQIGDLLFQGTIDESGEFVPDPTRAGLPVPRVTVVGGPQHLFVMKAVNEPVFEYRFGRLIPGHLLTRQFIPEIGGVVVDFNVYKKSCTRASRRVYNLPGKFVTLEAYRELERAGALTADDK